MEAISLLPLHAIDVNNLGNLLDHVFLHYKELVLVICSACIEHWNSMGFLQIKRGRIFLFSLLDELYEHLLYDILSHPQQF